jgi:hypothetical protein
MSQPSGAASLVQHVSSFSYSILRAKPFINRVQCEQNRGRGDEGGRKGGGRVMGGVREGRWRGREGGWMGEGGGGRG